MWNNCRTMQPEQQMEAKATTLVPRSSIAIAVVICIFLVYLMWCVANSFYFAVNSEGVKIALTAFATVLTLVIGQIIQRLFIEPIQEQKKVVAKVSVALTTRWLYGKSPGEKVHPKWQEMISDGVSELQQLAGELTASTIIPCYDMLATVRLVLPRKVVRNASFELMHWSLHMDAVKALESIDIIKGLLHIDSALPSTREEFNSLYDENRKPHVQSTDV